VSLRADSVFLILELQNALLEERLLVLSEGALLDVFELKKAERGIIDNFCTMVFTKTESTRE
jgi:hypothetical protein